MSKIARILLQASSSGAPEYYINIITEDPGSFNATFRGYPFVDSSDNIVHASLTNPYYFKTNSQVELTDTKTFTGSSFTLHGIALDDSDNTYISGDIVTSYSNPLVAKFNSSGTLQWAKSVNNAANSRAYSLAVGSSYVVAAGNAVPGSSVQIGVWAYDLSGNPLWNVIPGTSNSYGWSVALDEDASKCYVGTLTAKNAGMYAINLSNGSMSGAFRDQSTEGRFEGVGTDASGNVLGVGYYNSGSTYNAVLVKFNSSFTSVLWSKVLAIGTGFSALYYVVADSSDNIYVGGACNGGNHTFIGKYNSSGVFQWGIQIADVGLNNRTSTYKINLDSQENLIIAGYTSAVSGSNSNYDGFVMRYPNDGSITGTFGDFVISSLTPSTGSLSTNLVSYSTNTDSWSPTTSTWSIGTSDTSDLTNEITSL